MYTMNTCQRKISYNTCYLDCMVLATVALGLCSLLKSAAIDHELSQML